ncbi:transcription elongation factor, mitochondrial-like [Neocloeon triangulifer]|uniref:transcription elongation factor, mitochondrial-like n=1 Tax=Neocloeon triangulifer TaxID=2078957 RepID=UPI00286F1979|nr:transcription elongation factor, mitochondrial-like [Neocloeon triangulifer]
MSLVKLLPYNLQRFMRLVHRKEMCCLRRDLQPFCTEAVKIETKIERKFNFVEENGILKRINRSTVEQLVNLSFDFYEAEELKKYRKENGPFRKIKDLLNIPLMTEEKVDSICNLIAEENEEKNAKYIANILTPNFPSENTIKIQDMVGIIIGVDCSISWAHLTRDWKLNDWGQTSCLGAKKKLSAHEIFEAVVEACKTIPESDIYLLESLPHLMPQQAYVQTYIERKEVQAMLLALLNNRQPDRNKLFFMKSKFPTKLFNIKVGNERISSRPLVTKLLDGEAIGEKNPVSLKDLDPMLCERFFKLSGVQQEAYSNALILSMTFFKLLEARA